MRLIRSIAPAALLVASACVVHRAPANVAAIPKVPGSPRVQFALRSIDMVRGTGAEVAPRKCVYAHYTGWLLNGTKFDSSRDTMPNGRPRAPISFPQGARRVIVGWDLGFEGMRVGGQRRLFIPYQLAYRETARGATIPAKSDLIFDVELMAVADTLPRTDAAPQRGGAAPVPQCPAWDALSK